MNDESHGSPESSSSKSNGIVNKTTKEHDRVLPIANVGRIMKKVIPANGKISKEAKETVQECVSEFISFVTGEASDKCQREKRKTINGDDIIWAITILGFEDYVTPLKKYLSRYREIEGEKLNNVPKQQQQQQHLVRSDQFAVPSHMPLQQLLHHHREQQRQQQYDQFLQIDQALLPLESTTSVYSSTSTTLTSTPPSFPSVEQSFSYPFNSTPIQKNFQHQEQLDSMLGQW